MVAEHDEPSCVHCSNPGLLAKPHPVPPPCVRHELDVQGGHGFGPSQFWRGAPIRVDQGGPDVSIGGALRLGGDRDEVREGGQNTAATGSVRAQQGEPQEIRIGASCGKEPGHAGEPECHHSHHTEGSYAATPGRHPGCRWRCDGLREVLRENIPGGLEHGDVILRLGQGHLQGGEHVHLPEAFRGVDASERGLGYQAEGGGGIAQEEVQPHQEPVQDGGQVSDNGDTIGEFGCQPGCCDPAHGHGCSTRHRDQGDEGGEGERPAAQGRSDPGHPDGPEAQGLPLSQTTASALAHKSQLVVPNMFEELVGKERLEFMEIACEPDSLLTSVYQARTGRSESACRSSLWCGHDLATQEGLAIVVEQIRTLKPKRVWISPPCGPYSPLQNVNQKTPAQIQDLKAKRAVAQRIYESTEEIVKPCLQLGIHVSVELAERCEAWRLPVFQRLRFDMGLFTGVTKGCSVGLKGQDGRLMQKGWRIVTSMRRLSEKLHKPCMCPTNYKHAKCEGRNATKSAGYTKEFARLAVDAMLREGDFQGVIEECSGKSSLPEGFGLGLLCTCKGKDQACGSCLIVTPERMEQAEAQAMISTKSLQAMEQQATIHLSDPKKHSLDSLERFLREHPFSQPGKSYRNPSNGQDYQVYGAYTYGGHYGVTSKTSKVPEFCRYVNKILHKLMPKDMRWTSFNINHGTSLPIHRDHNNDPQYPNGTIGFGPYSGGNLWVEGLESVGGRLGKDSKRVNAKGEVLEGMEFEVKGQPLVFFPGKWHGACDWEGDRWVLTVFVSRSWSKLSTEEQQHLQSLGFPLPDEPQAEAYPAEHGGPQSHSSQEDERIKKQLYLLHCATGHSHPRHLEQALKKRGADERTLQLAREFSCPVCQERSKPQPRNLAALEPLPPKLCTISADVGHWVHPHTHEVFQFMLVIDEGSRFRTARVLSQGSKQSPNAQACLHYLQEGWVQYFGLPRCLRLDPAGVFRSTAVEDWCDKHGIHLDITPGEAHWKVGTCENAIKGVKSVMDKLCQHEEELSAVTALAEAVTTFNQKELIRGFSPAQHILGQAPDETGRFIPACQQLPPDLLVENSEGEFARSVLRRAEAEKALSEWQAAQRISRAQNSRHRPAYNFRPGELVFYWRTQEAGKGRRQPGGKHGRFLGTARILATESRTDDSGEVRPGGAVWLVKGRSLLKASPEQLRRASQREELIEALAENQGQRTPWTFQTVAAQIGGNRFEDVSKEIPEVSEWHRAQRPEDEAQPVRYRISRKRAATELTIDNPAPEEDEPLDIPDLEPPHEDSAPSRARSRSRERNSRGSTGTAAAAWWTTIADSAWPTQGSSYWASSDAAVAVEIPTPDTKRGLDKAWADLGGYFVGSMKRRAVELSERKMTVAERAAFEGAKAVEVKNFVASNAFEVLPDHLKPDRAKAIGMRWILTWKLKEDGSRKPKARAVLLGYQDASYEHRATTSPVMSRQTRQMVLQLASWKRWSLSKGDVTGAFLQSRQYPDQLFCVPTPEICTALGIPAGSITRVQRACYGLVDAPLEWWRSVDCFLQETGFERLWADPCCWVLRENGVLKGVVSGHVDEFLFAGKSGDRLWESKVRAIKDKYKWGDWDRGKFTQCGVVVEQDSKGFELSQPTYLENLHEIGVNSSRRKDPSSPTTDKEKTQLRALLGGLSWHAQQVAPYLAAEVSMLLTEVTRSSVATIIRANILLNQAKGKSNYKMRVHNFREEDELILVAWVDAGNNNRADGGSTQGIFIGMTTKGMLDGEISQVSPIAWHSQKIDRVCRSPGAAEAQAAINGEDNLYYARYQWAELLYGRPDLQRPDLTVAKVSGCVVTDSRNVYDKLDTEVLTIKGAEKRTHIELLALKEAQWGTGVQVRWVHSEAQLANTLTKSSSTREYELFIKMGHQWRLVEDESMMSAKRRKEAGLQPLEQSKSRDDVFQYQQSDVYHECQNGDSSSFLGIPQERGHAS